MNLSMFCRSHFSHFISDPTRNPKPMSKRGKEQTSSEGSAMAKPETMSRVQAEAKPRNLVSQVSHSSSRGSESSSSATALSNLEIRGTALTQTSGFKHSFGKPERDTSNIVRHSQVRTRENYAVKEFLGVDGEAIGIFSQDSQHCRFFNRSRTTCKARTSNRNNFLTGSS